MKKRLIEGINGSLELNDKYVYVVLKNMNNGSTEEHIVWFEEIEDILYKKPTKNKRGFISLYLSTRSFVTNRKKVYLIILDKVDDKSLETNNKIYSFIKDIVIVRNVKIVETLEEEKQEEKEESLEEEFEKFEEVINDYNKEEQKEGDLIERVGIDINSIEQEKEKTTPKKEQENKKKEEQKEVVEYKTVTLDEVIKNIDEEFIEQEEKEELEEKIDEEKKVKATEKLEEKIKELEKEIQKISYEQIIIGKYVDITLDRKKAEKLIIEIKKLIERIEKLRKEIIRHEKVLNGNEFIKLDNGNVIVLSFSKEFLNETELKKYVESYKRTIKELNIVQEDTDKLKKTTEEKKTNIGLTDDLYEKRINEFSGVKNNKEYIKKLIDEAKEDLSRVRWRIESTVEQRYRYRIVYDEAVSRTRRLAALTALNELRPNRSKFSILAMVAATGLSAIQSIYGFELKREEYNEIVQREILEGLENVDTKEARLMLLKSKDQIDEILNDCKKKYGEYPQFGKLKKDLLGIKKDIEKQDKELSIIEDKIVDYKLGPKVKTLRFKQN